MELLLDRRLSERRIFPSIDILRSGTRKEELLFTQEELSRTWLLRKYLADKNPMECMEFMREKMADTKDNKDFFKYMNAWGKVRIFNISLVSDSYPVVTGIEFVIEEEFALLMN